MSYREELDTLHERELLGYLDSHPEPHRSQHLTEKRDYYAEALAIIAGTTRLLPERAHLVALAAAHRPPEGV